MCRLAPLSIVLKEITAELVVDGGHSESRYIRIATEATILVAQFLEARRAVEIVDGIGLLLSFVKIAYWTSSLYKLLCVTRRYNEVMITQIR